MSDKDERIIEVLERIADALEALAGDDGGITAQGGGNGHPPGSGGGGG